MMKNYFSKKLEMTKEHNKYFENSIKCWICDNDYIDNDEKGKGLCHNTGNNRDSAHRDCNINVK